MSRQVHKKLKSPITDITKTEGFAEKKKKAQFKAIQREKRTRQRVKAVSHVARTNAHPSVGSAKRYFTRDGNPMYC